MNAQQYSVVIAFLSAVAFANVPHIAPDDRPTLLATLSNPHETLQTRHAAEDSLQSASPIFLRHLFPALDEPVNGRDPLDIIRRVSGPPSKELDSLGYSPAAQVVYARLRLWDHLVKHSEPADERARQIASLCAAAETPVQKARLLDAAIWNWTPEIETVAASWLLDPEQPCTVRDKAAARLGMHARSAWREQILTVAWSQRHDPCALRIASAVTNSLNGAEAEYDARVAALLADQFDQSLDNPDRLAALAAGTMLADYLRFTVVPPADARLSVRSDAWRDHVIETTKTWLNEHRERLEADAAKAAAGEKTERPPAQPGWRPYDHDHAERIMRENIERAKNP